MKAALVAWVLNLAARLPLALLHRLGAGLGWITYKLSVKYANRLRENFRNAYKDYAEADFHRMLNANVAEIGKGIVELPWVWLRPLDEVLNSVKTCHGMEYLEAARSRGAGVIMLTPHLGCFEIIALYVAARMPMTCMYRPPKLAWLDGIIRGGRERGQMRLARTDIGGVRTLYKTLKRGEVIGLLPDQVPGNGEGEWADFFGRPAYTMTLVARLAEASGATVLMSYSERLPQGAGYVIHITPLEFSPGESIPKQINIALEQAIRACPTQYLWGYNRYKTPTGVLPAPAERTMSEQPEANKS